MKLSNPCVGTARWTRFGHFVDNGNAVIVGTDVLARTASKVASGDLGKFTLTAVASSHVTGGSDEVKVDFVTVFSH
jgi:hypothetical protein